MKYASRELNIAHSENRNAKNKAEHLQRCVASVIAQRAVIKIQFDFQVLPQYCYHLSTHLFHFSICYCCTTIFAFSLEQPQTDLMPTINLFPYATKPQ